MSFLSHRNLADGLRAVRAVRTARGPNPLIIKRHRRKQISKCGRCGGLLKPLILLVRAGAGGAGEIPPYPPGRKSAPLERRARPPCHARHGPHALVAARQRVILAALNNHHRARGP
jgi:hypothetical protein